MVTARTESEVKGAYFVTARRYLARERGEECLAATVAAMPRHTRESLDNPLSSSWYPEEALRDALAAFERVAAGGDRTEFSRMMEACTVDGTRNFVKALLAVSSPRFLLNRYPMLSGVFRRGPCRVEVEHALDGASFVRYDQLPFADDPRYHCTAAAGLRALLRLTTRRTPDVKVTRFDARFLELRVQLDARQ